MKFNEYWNNLSNKEREAYAESAGTTVLTVDRKYLNAKNIPRRQKIKQLVAATDGAVSRNEMLEHFYPIESHESVA